VGGEIEQMRTELAQAVSAAPAAELPNPTEFDAALDEEEGRGDDYYASLEQQRQTELMHEQDEQLDGVFRTVGNLRQQANDMGRELEDQAVMIEEVDTLADRVGGKLNNGMARIRHIVRKNEGKHAFLHGLSNFLRGLLVYLDWSCAVLREQMGIMKFSKLTFSSPPQIHGHPFASRR
jgi:t-SNARE syntaxin family protein